MRIVAGAAGGRRLVVPKGRSVRPTADRVREALFSSLAPYLPGAAVLDLFAGTGALGLEALSRGADHVTFVERSRPSLQALERNIEVVGLPGTIVVRADVMAAVGGELTGAPFDLVLADPPYDLPGDVLDALLSALPRHLADGAIVVVERDDRADAPTWPRQLIVAEVRRYGGTALHRAEHRPEPGRSGEEGPG
jgi:16S rRNA (guanine966-N2)-methyltransferase